jgi:TusA-related sulfurtransferase
LRLIGPPASLLVDARDQPCPKPMLVFKRAFQRAESGDLLEVVVNDRVSKDNVLSFCLKRGEEVVNAWAEGADFHLLIKKSAARIPDLG